MSAQMRLWLVAGTLVVAGACGAPIQSGGTFERDVSPIRYTTFGWDQSMDSEVGDPRLDGNVFFEESLHEAIRRELLWRGIAYDPVSPAMIVHHHTAVEEHVWLAEASDETGEEASYEYPEGRIVVHVLDAQSGATLWVGWAQSDLDPAFTGPRVMTRWVDDLVSKVFETWPGPERSFDSER